jgi:hypothetical protein
MTLSELAPLGAWLWKNYGNLVIDKAAGPLKNRWNKIRWNEAADKYCAKVKHLHGTIQIMGMSEPVPLEDIFTDVYLLDRPSALRRYDIAKLVSEENPTQELLAHTTRINGLRLVGDNQNLFILGKPGAGKTTFSKYIALKAAEQVIDKVPIFVSLKQWADSGIDLMSFIAQQFDICNFPAADQFVDTLLESGQAIVLFDGLDEVNLADGQRDIQATAIENFVNKHNLTQCLITCRIAASDYTFQRFKYVEISDFNETQIEKFIRNWFRNSKGEKDEQLSKLFLDEFQKDENFGLRDLARTPLLLTLLCLAFSETLSFPRRRAEIYKEAIDALLKKWDASRRIKRDEVYRQLSLAHKENLLSALAWATFDDGQYFISLPILEKLVERFTRNVPPHDLGASDSFDIIKAIEARHGILVEQFRGVYSFSHLTFQEYFTAKYIVDNADTGRLSSLVHDHLADERWREVFLLTTSLLPDARTFINTLRSCCNFRVGSDEKLMAFLRWTDTKISLFETPWVSRLTYIFLELHNQPLGRKLANAVNSLRIRLGYDQNKTAATNFTLALDYCLSSCLALVRDISIRISEDRSHAGHLSGDVSRALSEAEYLSNQLGLTEFSEELKQFSAPFDKVWADKYGARFYFASLETVKNEWLETVIRLRELVRQYRNFGYDWNFDDGQENLLADYLTASLLLQDCLEVAFISPSQKSEVEFGLFRG